MCMAGDRTCSCRCRRTGHHVAGMGRRSSASRSRFHRREAGRSETKRTRPRVEYRWTHADRSSRRRCAPRWLRDWHLGRVDAPPRLYEASHACHQILALTTAGLTRRGGVATIGKLPPKRFHPIDPKPAAATAALCSRRRKSWLWTPAAAQSPTSNKRHSQGTGSRSRRGERGARPSGRIPRSPSARVEGASRAANTARVGRQRAGGEAGVESQHAAAPPWRQLVGREGWQRPPPLTSHPPMKGSATGRGPVKRVAAALTATHGMRLGRLHRSGRGTRQRTARWPCVVAAAAAFPTRLAVPCERHVALPYPPLHTTPHAPGDVEEKAGGYSQRLQDIRLLGEHGGKGAGSPWPSRPRHRARTPPPTDPHPRTQPAG